MPKISQLNQFTVYQPAAMVPVVYQGNTYRMQLQTIVDGVNQSSLVYGETRGEATAAGYDVTVKAGSFALKDGVLASIQFVYGHTQSSVQGLSLNIGGTGNKAVYINNSSFTLDIPSGGWIQVLYTEGYYRCLSMSSVGGSYVLPVATADTLGGVMPVAKTDTMSQAVGVDGDGRLYTAPSAGGASKGAPTYVGSCSTTSATAAKVVTTSAGDYALEAWSVIYIKMTNTTTATSPTLNIDGTGAKPLKYIGTTAAPSYAWLAGEVICVLYDGTNYIVLEGGRASTTAYGMTKLSTSYSSTSQTEAATPYAVNQVRLLAAGKATAETGTWTPTLYGASTAGSMTATAVGQYVKIGSHVHVEGNILISAVATAPLGYLQLGGLPYACKTGAYGKSHGIVLDSSGYNTANPGAICKITGLSITVGSSFAYLLCDYVDSTYGLVRTWAIGAASTTAKANIKLEANSRLYFSLDYEAEDTATTQEGDL